MKICGMMRHNRQEKIGLVVFPKNLLLGQYGPNFTQNYTVLYRINCSRDF